MSETLELFLVAVLLSQIYITNGKEADSTFFLMFRGDSNGLP